VNGLGVSHPFAATAGGQTYLKPLQQMGAYLRAMDAALIDLPLDPGPEAATTVPRLIGAVGPKMMELARDMTAGAMPRFTTTAYTKVVRALLGPNRILAPEQAIVLETDPSKARATARRFTSFYVGLENYRRLLKLMGFDDEDYANGGSDRLVDAIVAWGDANAIARRVREHLDAGADHVMLHPQGDGVSSLVEQLEGIAPTVLAR
jgi:probable F420-dependent oxidoreductase